MNICFNGKFLPEGEPVLLVNNRAFSYGDGLFETMRIHNATIPLASFHFDRLFDGLKTLKISDEKLNADSLTSCILQLCEMNTCLHNGRVRLEVYRSDEGRGHFTIEARPIDPSYIFWNDKGWDLGVFGQGRKSSDSFSMLKSSNYLLYAMAALFAKENSWNDAIVLNNAGRICDSGKANIFIVQKNEILTPPLSEGCVAGVMRSFILSKMPAINERAITLEELLSAEEVFLTNALFGIRWVSRIGRQEFRKDHSKKLYQMLMPTIFH
jgi:branched-chain amino acid aminotransferase